MVRKETIMKTATATISIKVKFEFDEKKSERLRDAAETASNLATDGVNTHTVENGVHILDYETCLDDYQILYE